MGDKTYLFVGHHAGCAPPTWSTLELSVELMVLLPVLPDWARFTSQSGIPGCSLLQGLPDWAGILIGINSATLHPALWSLVWGIILGSFSFLKSCMLPCPFRFFTVELNARFQLVSSSTDFFSDLLLYFCFYPCVQHLTMVFPNEKNDLIYLRFLLMFCRYISKCVFKKWMYCKIVTLYSQNIFVTDPFKVFGNYAIYTILLH